MKNVFIVFAAWVAGGLTAIAADQVQAWGVPGWPAIFVALGTIPVAMGVAWLLSARKSALLAAGFLPAAVLGVTGFITGAATPGHRFVLAFVTVPAVIAAIVVARNASRRTTS